AKSDSPVLALCRKLVDAGHDRATPLEAYRDNTFALRVKSIGQGAQMQVNGNTRLVFAGDARRRTAPPMRSFSEAAECTPAPNANPGPPMSQNLELPDQQSRPNPGARWSQRGACKAQ